MKKKKSRIFVADFETTVFSHSQDSTEVWAAAIVELYDTKVRIMNRIEKLMNFLISLHENSIVYYHNLKFDGSFILDLILHDSRFHPALEKVGQLEYEIDYKKDIDMKKYEFKTSISDKGQWYTITICMGNYFIEFRDSLKLLPFSVRQIGESFDTKHKKLDMDYIGERHAGGKITPKEQHYIANDVLVVKEALEILFSEGHDRLTIGSCCMKEFKDSLKYTNEKYPSINTLEYEEMFPNLFRYDLESPFLLDYPNAPKSIGEYIYKSYGGGWCYVNSAFAERELSNGVTFDVNSLYPSMMHSISGNEYPIGMPFFFKGEIPKKALLPERYYFVRIKTRFYLKEGKLPFIHIRNSYLYDANDNLTSSDIYDPINNVWRDTYIDFDGTERDTRQIMTLTCTDFEMLKEHYELVDFEILDGCWFYTLKGIFDDYINYFMNLKKVSTGAKRQLAKLFLNNLYGKMAANTNSSFKVPYLKENGVVGYHVIEKEDKTPGYIPIGSAITSYSRQFTIKAAQANYTRFAYADTDSIHCVGKLEDIKGIEIDSKELCCWKYESNWDKAIFTRQKTYIEHIIGENGKEVEPYHNLKCAGMGNNSKILLEMSFDGDYQTLLKEGSFTKHGETYTIDDFNEIDLEFIKTTRSYSDFQPGLVVPGKLIPKTIKGGVLLTAGFYEMRD